MRAPAAFIRNSHRILPRPPVARVVPLLRHLVDDRQRSRTCPHRRCMAALICLRVCLRRTHRRRLK